MQINLCLCWLRAHGDEPLRFSRGTSPGRESKQGYYLYTLALREREMLKSERWEKYSKAWSKCQAFYTWGIGHMTLIT